MDLENKKLVISKLKVKNPSEYSSYSNLTELLGFEELLKIKSWKIRQGYFYEENKLEVKEKFY
ncbi:hypothetical protein [Flexithrix dorotheae]|uniref:hypothetical protein n=1 Tax=Flexithrix dorotheae TaxID=70993 RepID=UPI00035C1B38|nr:hypothetical protein [Flexithrix dorotheae]